MCRIVPQVQRAAVGFVALMLLLCGCAHGHASGAASTVNITTTETEPAPAASSHGPIGVGPTTTTATDCPILSAATAAADLGVRWEINETGVTVKLYPSCAATHPPLDALTEIVRREAFTSEQVEAIDVEVDSMTPRLLIHPNPASGLEAKFSMPFCAAAAVVYPRIGIDTFEVGGFKVLREGKDLAFVAAGYTVHECLKAADELAKAGKKAAVIDAYGLPLKTDDVLKIAERSGGRVVTVEDNYTGGLDAELATAIAATGAGVRLTNLYVRRIPKSGREPQDVLDYLDLGVKAIVAAV